MLYAGATVGMQARLDAKADLSLALNMLIDLMENNALDNVATIDYDAVLADFFSDATGYKNTIASSTGEYDSTNKKFKGAPTAKDTVHGSGLNTNFNADYYMAVKFTAGSSYTATHVGLNMNSAEAHNFVAGIYTDDSDYPGTLLAQSAQGTSLSSEWNSVELQSGVSISNSTAYWIVVLADGDMDFVREGVGGRMLYKTKTYSSTMDATFPGGGTDDNNTDMNMRTEAPGASVVSTGVIETAGSNITHVQVFTKSPGGDTLTVDISTDNGANWDTAQVIGDKITITTPGTQLKLKFNLDSDEDMSGYSVAWWLA